MFSFRDEGRSNSFQFDTDLFTRPVHNLFFSSKEWWMDDGKNVPLLSLSDIANQQNKMPSSHIFLRFCTSVAAFAKNVGVM